MPVAPSTSTLSRPANIAIPFIKSTAEIAVPVIPYLSENFLSLGLVPSVELVVNNWFNTVDGNFAEILRYDEGKIAGVTQEVVIRQYLFSDIPTTILL